MNAESRIAELEALLAAAVDTAVMYKNCFDEARGREWDICNEEEYAAAKRSIEKRIRKQAGIA